MLYSIHFLFLLINTILESRNQSFLNVGLGQGAGSKGEVSYELVANSNTDSRGIYLNTKGEVIYYRNATGHLVLGILCTNSLIK